MSAVLITGATGFVGSELARTLLSAPWTTRVVLLIRPLPGQSGEARWQRLVHYWARYFPALPAGALMKAEVLEHDLTHAAQPSLAQPVEYILHAAASTDLDRSLAESRRSNLYATQRLLAFARTQPGLARFLHFSTAYVSGRDRGVLREDALPPRAYHNAYEQSKRETESCVAASGVPYTIVRPSIIVGRSDSGYVVRMKVLYAVWRIWLTGTVPRAPLDPRSWIDIVPVDYVVDAALALLTMPESLAQTVHLVAGAGRQSPATVMLAAAKVFDVAPPPLSPPWVVALLRSPLAQPFLGHALRETLDKMHWQVPYIGMRNRMFDGRKADALLAGRVQRPQFADYGEQLFRFCRDTAWGKRPLQPALTPGARAGKEAACSQSAS